MPKIKYTNKDLEESLRIAFVDKRFNSIRMDGEVARRSPYLVAGVDLGLTRGWLYHIPHDNDEQWSSISYPLTKKGKTYFGLSE